MPVHSLQHRLIFVFLLLMLPSSGGADRYSRPASVMSEWRYARATYYAAGQIEDTGKGACGYGDLMKGGYGMATAAVSEAVFEHGQICGACFEIRCVEELRWCIAGTSIVVTATNFCMPDYGLPADGGGHCNPPNLHFVMPILAFEKIAIWKASNMPIQFRRVKCQRADGIRFTLDGEGYFLSVLISNVAGAGDIVAVKIKGSTTGWLQMGRNWGQNWHINANLKNQPLSFEVTSSDEAMVTSYSVAPKDWTFGQTFVGRQFKS